MEKIETQRRTDEAGSVLRNSSAPLRPPHSEFGHPCHDYYRPDTDDYPPEEADIEAKWRQTKGVDDDGKAWITPRMERNAIALAERMASWPNR